MRDFTDYVALKLIVPQAAIRQSLIRAGEAMGFKFELVPTLVKDIQNILGHKIYSKNIQCLSLEKQRLKLLLAGLKKRYKVQKQRQSCHQLKQAIKMLEDYIKKERL